MANVDYLNGLRWVPAPGPVPDGQEPELIDLGPPARGTLIRGYVTDGRPEYRDADVDGDPPVKVGVFDIALSSDLKRYVRCYAADVLAQVKNPEGYGSIVRVKETAELQYVVAYHATGDDIGDLLTGEIARRHRPGEPDDDGGPPKSPQPCAGTPSL